MILDTIHLVMVPQLARHVHLDTPIMQQAALRALHVPLGLPKQETGRDLVLSVL